MRKIFAIVQSVDNDRVIFEFGASCGGTVGKSRMEFITDETTSFTVKKTIDGINRAIRDLDCDKDDCCKDEVSSEDIAVN